MVIFASANHVENSVPRDLLGLTLDAYQIVLARTFALPIAAGRLAFLRWLGLKLRSVKEQGTGRQESESSALEEEKQGP